MKYRLIAIFFIVIFIVSLSSLYKDIHAAKSIEETADMKLSNDRVITGVMDEFSRNTIVLDGRTHYLCKKPLIFSNQNKIIPLKDLEAAEELRIFSKGRCIRKIHVLRFKE